MAHLPLSRDEMATRGWDELDFLFVTGDAYVDHPSFGAALLTRLLEAEGYRVGLAVQPAPGSPDSLLAMGRPRLAALVSSGVVDSMVNNYTASGKPRRDDRYSVGAAGGIRPDRTVIRYCGLIRDQMGDIPLIIGGIEASLRRFAHYDYWSRQVRRSILQDSQADLLIYGMGELPLLEVAGLLARGVPIRKINAIRGTCVLAKPEQLPSACAAFIRDNPDFRLNASARTVEQLTGKPLPEDEARIMLPPFDEVVQDKTAFAIAFRYQYQEQDPGAGKTLLQQHSRRYLVQNPPQRPLTMAEMDRIAALPYERTAHPRHLADGHVPSLEEVRFSINSHRGCFGGCHYCAITLHQGRIVQRRSDESILAEARLLSGLPDFKGYIHDVGGPTANFFQAACSRQRQGSVCKNRQCLFPEPCPALESDHSAYLSVLRRLRSLPGIKKVFIRSGIRFDYLLMDVKTDFLQELCRHHVSGQLKVAPEHVSRRTLQAMGKPGPEVWQAFRERYAKVNRDLGLQQYLVPYLISGHPGCTLDDAIELALEIKHTRVMPEQVQDFYPTPGTWSTAMYYTGMDPLTLKPVHVPDNREKILQRALLQFGKPENHRLVLEALRCAGRADLIGYGPDKLVPASIRRNNERLSKREAHQDGHPTDRRPKR
ncbi:MAG TPA: YgiQ family radical SAM protein [Clostridiales bacterium]|nr:YgiQ family radical SAM protein [Clostridiales bacterium]